VRRGAAASPLYVTAAGMPRADAAELVRRMADPFRVPDALGRAAQLARMAPSGALQQSLHPDR
jgi:deoxyribonuclease V